VSEELLPLASVHDLREAQRVAMLGTVDRLDRISRVLLESAGGHWLPVQAGTFRFEGQQDRVVAWESPDGWPYKALASELVAIALGE
jgi:hypothetical protein